jgi:ubiquinone/menaquinone biosynthesis C-methylase UbiE
MDDMMKELLRVLKPGGYVLIREHNLTNPDDAIFYNIIHALYACVLKSEMTPYDFVESFVDAEQTSYYSKYRSIAEWIKLFRGYRFMVMRTGAHGFYDQRNRTYKFDQMNGFYQLFQLQ